MVKSLHQLPPPSPPSRPLWFLAWTIGVLMGLFLRDLIAGATVAGPSLHPPPSFSQPLPPPTVVVQVEALLTLPTATPTPTRAPTLPPTPNPRDRVPFCSTPVAGEICKVAMPSPTPAPSPTSYPSCLDHVQPGELCQWPAALPDPLPPTPTPTSVIAPSPGGGTGGQR